MPLSDPQQQFLENWMRSKAIVHCPLCADSSWKLAEASYVRALLEQGDTDLTEGGAREGLVQQMRVHGALRHRDAGHPRVVGPGEEPVTPKGPVP